MKSPTITLCTYTYNDAEFVEDLVRRSQYFTVKPDEIVVVDDGSDVEFAMVDAPENLRIIRHESNLGITEAKGAGLSEATGDYIFSMDCDTRVSPDWLERNISYLEKSKVGLVGGALIHQSGDDLVSRYMRIFGDNHNLSHIGSVDFIPGNAFLLERKTWEKVGGFSGYHQTNCQDHYLCNKLREAGYTLFSNAEAKAWQRRRVSRTTMCKRVWKWCHKPIKEQAVQADDVVTYLFGTLVAPMLDRCHDAAKMGEPLFYYLELLYLAHAVLDVLDFLVHREIIAASLRADFMAGLAHLFRGTPRIWALLKADLLLMGQSPSQSSSGDASRWDDFFMFAEMFRNGGLLSWLDRDGMILLVKDELNDDYHFSSYAKTSFAM
jgi:GT2 family glycosyltransferase